MKTPNDIYSWSSALVFGVCALVLAFYWIHRKRARKAKKILTSQKMLTWEAVCICNKLNP